VRLFGRYVLGNYHDLSKARGLFFMETIQQILFSPEVMPEEQLIEEEKSGHYTGERLEAQRPAIYQAIVLMLAVGLGRLEVSKRCGVSHHTVEAVRIREGDAIAIDKKRLAGRMRDVVAMGIDAITDDFLDDWKRWEMSTKDKAIIVGILNQHSQLLDGEATAIVGKADGGARSVDAVAEYINSLRMAGETGHAGGEAKQKGAAGPGGAGVQGVLIGSDLPGGVDGALGGLNMSEVESIGRGRDWLAWLGRFEALLAGRVVLALPEPVGLPGANLGGSMDRESTDINGGISDGGE